MGSGMIASQMPQQEDASSHRSSWLINATSWYRPGSSPSLQAAVTAKARTARASNIGSEINRGNVIEGTGKYNSRRCKAGSKTRDWRSLRDRPNSVGIGWSILSPHCTILRFCLDELCDRWRETMRGSRQFNDTSSIIRRRNWVVYFMRKHDIDRMIN